MTKKKKQSQNWKPFIWGLIGTIFALSLNGVLLTYIFKDNTLIAFLVTGGIIVLGLFFGWISSRTKKSIFGRFK